MIKNILALSALAIAATGAWADDAAPLVLKPPYPSGLVGPRLVSERPFNPALSLVTLSGHALCVVLDVGVDGAVSHVKVLHSIGLREVDSDLVTWYKKKKYEPATVNGTKVAVRMLSEYAIIPKPASDWYIVGAADAPNDAGCSWDGLTVSPSGDVSVSGKSP